MKKFLVIYGMPAAAMAEMMKNSSPEEHKKGMDEWKQWMEANKDSFVDMGAPAGKNTRVTNEGATEVSNEIGGYSVMQAESKEDLIKVLAGNPHYNMPGAYIEVMESVAM